MNGIFTAANAGQIPDARTEALAAAQTIIGASTIGNDQFDAAATATTRAQVVARQ
jgi:hypothetical protein